ncbi:MAG: terminase small subunit [Planctomycetota bacterium]|jgi:phage terminase small subunit
MIMNKLTIKQKRFADIYYGMPEPNQRRAYIEAGYKAQGATADVNACRLLKNAKVRAYLQELRDAATENTLIYGTKIINEYAIPAFYDIADYFNEDMTMKPLDHKDHNNNTQRRLRDHHQDLRI